MSPSNQRGLGKRYEDLARDFLVSRGLSFISANFHTKFGEIDLIMKQAKCLVFVEVKYRKNALYGHASEFVNQQKSRRLIKAANIWLSQQGLSPHKTEFRFDVIAVHQQGSDINWIKNAIVEG